MKCKNSTCDRDATRTYCSRDCQLATRTVSQGKQIPDLWVPMKIWHRLVEVAAAEKISVRDLCLMAIEDEVVFGFQPMLD